MAGSVVGQRRSFRSDRRMTTTPDQLVKPDGSDLQVDPYTERHVAAYLTRHIPLATPTVLDGNGSTRAGEPGVLRLTELSSRRGAGSWGTPEALVAARSRR